MTSSVERTDLDFKISVALLMTTAKKWEVSKQIDFYVFIFEQNQ